MADTKQVTIEGAQLLFRNFEGKEGQYNQEGSRNFACIIPTEELAEALLRDGWNIKYLNPRDEGDEPTPYIQIAVNYQNKPPRVVMIAGGVRTALDEKSVAVLDWADMANVDLIFNAYEWEVNGKTGTKAYLKTMFVTVMEDEIERKYADLEGGGG